MESLKLLEKINQSSALSPSEIETLLQEELQDKSFCNIFNINPENGREKINNRLDLLGKSYHLIAHYCHDLGFNTLDLKSTESKLVQFLLTGLDDDNDGIRKTTLQSLDRCGESIKKAAIEA